MPYYVYAFWRGDGFWIGTTGRQLLTFPNKTAADLLYRGIQANAPVAISEGLTITKVERLHDTFWNVYGTPASNVGWAMHNLVNDISGGKFKDKASLDIVRGKVSLILMPDIGGRDMPIIPHWGGPDTVSGGTFYLRSKSNPDQYWHAANEHVEASTQGKSRIRISAVDPNLKGEVLIDSDMVRLSAVGGGVERPIYVDEHGHLVLRPTDRREVPFGSLNGGIDADHGLSPAVLKLTPEGESGAKLGEEWELA